MSWCKVPDGDARPAPAARAHEHRRVRPRPRLPARGLRAEPGPARRRPADLRVAQLEVRRVDRRVRARRGGRAHPRRRRSAPTARCASSSAAPTRHRAAAPDGEPARRDRAPTSRPGRRATWCACCAPTPTPASWCGRRSTTERRGPSSVGATPSPRPSTAWRWSSSTTATSGRCRSCRRIAGIAEAERGRPVNPLPDPLGRLPADPAAAFRAAVEAERWRRRRRWCSAPSTPGATADELRPWFTAIVSDHHLSYGHAAIYAQKAFQLLERLGWDRADTVLPHLVPTIVYGTREDTLPYMRPVRRGRSAASTSTRWPRSTADPTWRDDGRLVAALLDERRSHRPRSRAAVDALRDGAGIDGLLDVVVAAVVERMLRYDVAGEFDFHDDFGWLDITHGMTYANAARWHADRRAAIPTCCGWRCGACSRPTGPAATSGTPAVGEPDAVDLGADDLGVRAAGEALQRRRCSTTRRRRSSSTPTPSRPRRPPPRRPSAPGTTSRAPSGGALPGRTEARALRRRHRRPLDRLPVRAHPRPTRTDGESYRS